MSTICLLIDIVFICDDQYKNKHKHKNDWHSLHRLFDDQYKNKHKHKYTSPISM